MNSIILEDVKKQIGDFYEGDHFDIDLVIHINTALFILNQMGIGVDGFAITLTGEEKWSDFLKSSQLNLHAIKSWVYLKVRMIFDPPTSSIVKESFEKLLNEFEWRMYITENYIGEIGSTEDTKKPFDKIVYYDPYLYRMDFSKLDYDYANKYFKSDLYEPTLGACSSVRNGNWYGRTFDYVYGDQVEFAVFTNITGKHRTVGVSGKIEGLNAEFVESGKESDLYKIVPFMIVDGINDSGLVCNVNLVPNDCGNTIGTVPALETKHTLSSVMLPRFILDNFSKAKSAVNYLKEYVSVFVPKKLRDMGFEEHFMVADEEDTYIIEFMNNELHFIDVSEKPYMTNFFIKGVTFKEDGKVYTPQDAALGYLPSLLNGITQNGSGLERYNFIVDEYSNSASCDGMTKLMNKLRYTKSYKPSTDPYWYSEFVGKGLTVDSFPIDFSQRVASAREAFLNRKRTGSLVNTWQTNHTCVYDINNKTLYLHGQENSDCIYELEV